MKEKRVRVSSSVMRESKSWIRTSTLLIASGGGGWQWSRVE